MRILSLMVVLCSLNSAFAKLEVKNIQASHGPYGPERDRLEYYPNDEIYFRFQLHDVKTDKEGKTDVEQVIKLITADGKTVFEPKGTIARPLMLGGNRFTFQAFVGIPPKVNTGEYTLSVTLTDRIAKESVSFERKISIKPTQFGILTPRFFRDTEGKIAAPPAGWVNENIHFRLFCVGFDKKNQKVQVHMKVQVLDESGKEVMPTPILVRVETKTPQEAESAIKLTFNGTIALTRAGNFKIVITVEDLQGNQKTTFTSPLKVMDP